MRGKLAILAMLALAVAATGFAIWYQRQMTFHVLRWAGPASARCISRAERVEYLELRPSATGSEKDPGDTLSLPHTQLVITRRTDISKAAGLVHLRHALLQNASYDWQVPADRSGSWQFALRFVDGQHLSTLLFDLDHQCVLNLERGQMAVLGAKINQGLRDYSAKL